MAKKKFKDTKLGNFLKEKFPKALEVVGDVLPDRGVLGVVKNLVSKDNTLDDETRLEALKMIQEYEETELKEVTKRWEADATSDSWLSKNVRPITLLFLLLVVTVLVILDSLELAFHVEMNWVDLFKMLLEITILAYFGGRSVEKYKKIK